jgi:hypothetical protein
VDEPPPSDTTLALVNAVYFKGDWETPFIEKITRKSHFHVKKNETIQVQMMTNVLTIPYFENEDYQMIAIPYKGNKMGFFVLLPKASNGIEGLKVISWYFVFARHVINTIYFQFSAIGKTTVGCSTKGFGSQIESNAVTESRSKNS